MAALVFLYKLSHEIKVTYVQELIDALRYVGRTLLAARPLELAMGNVRAAICFLTQRVFPQSRILSLLFLMQLGFISYHSSCAFFICTSS